MSNTNNLIRVFLDPIGRIIVGKCVKETEEVLVVESPGLVHVQPNAQANQLQMQILPLIFKELLEPNSPPPSFTYNQANITMANDMVFAPQFYQQYQQVCIREPAVESEPEVVSLVEEEAECETKNCDSEECKSSCTVE